MCSKFKKKLPLLEKWTIFVLKFEAIHNKDYSVVKTFKAGLTVRLLLLNRKIFLIYVSLLNAISRKINQAVRLLQLICD